MSLCKLEKPIYFLVYSSNEIKVFKALNEALSYFSIHDCESFEILEDKTITSVPLSDICNFMAVDENYIKSKYLRRVYGKKEAMARAIENQKKIKLSKISIFLRQLSCLKTLNDFHLQKRFRKIELKE